MQYGQELKDLVLQKAGSTDPEAFQAAMKTDHVLAMEYIARLLRRMVDHNGPVKRHEINLFLKEDGVTEFQELLKDNLSGAIYLNAARDLLNFCFDDIAIPFNLFHSS
jgi:hypothetical protein